MIFIGMCACRACLMTRRSMSGSMMSCLDNINVEFVGSFLVCCAIESKNALVVHTQMMMTHRRNTEIAKDALVGAVVVDS